MSSIKYSTELVPDQGLRRLVLIVGATATGAGVAIIAGLPLEAHWRVVTALAWCLISGRDLLHIARGNKLCERLHVDEDGAVRVFDADGCCTAATIASGSIVLTHLAWLRLHAVTGRRHVELLRRDGAGNDAWRRLQVIWRHLGAPG